MASIEQLSELIERFTGRDGVQQTAIPREYSRLFGAPPARDLKRLREPSATSGVPA